MQSNLFIIGVGGLGREMAATLFYSGIKAKYNLIGFIDDNYSSLKEVNGIKVVGNTDYLQRLESGCVIIGVGNPSIRKTIYNRISNQRALSFPSIYHPNASILSNDYVQIEQGCYIADGCILTTNISIGKLSYLLPGVSLSHDTIIGEFCTLMPGVRISSGATIGNGVTIGTGAIIAAPVNIPDGTSIPSGSIITGNP